MRVSVGGGFLQGASVDLVAGRKAAALSRRTRRLERKILRLPCLSSSFCLLVQIPMLRSPRYAGLQV